MTASNALPDPIESLVFPRPRSVRRSGEGPASLDQPPRSVHDASLPAQGYTLEATASGVEIHYADPAGERYARSTLAQLAAASGPLPALRIEDGPDFPVRGYMLDISRDRSAVNRHGNLHWLPPLDLRAYTTIRVGMSTVAKPARMPPTDWVSGSTSPC